MALTSWFFDSSSGTESLFLEFMGYIMKRNGFLNGILNGMAPSQSTPAGMSVAINTGVAWINGSVVKNSASYPVTIETADATYPRIDRVVIRHSPSSNSNIIAVLKGTAAATPAATALTQNSSTWEIAICDVAVAANATSIVNANITSHILTDYGGLASCNLGRAYTEADGTINLYQRRLTGMLDPVGTTDSVSKNHLDTYFALKASPTLTGTPLAPTAAAGTNTTQIATSAFVQTALGAWANWTPTLTWTGVAASGVTTKARYVKIGKTVFFELYIRWTATSTTTDLSVTGLPGTLITTIDRVAVNGYAIRNASTFYAPNAYIETGTPALYLWSFAANSSSNTGALNLQGFYEVSS